MQSELRNSFRCCRFYFLNRSQLVANRVGMALVFTIFPSLFRYQAWLQPPISK